MSRVRARRRVSAALLAVAVGAFGLVVQDGAKAVTAVTVQAITSSPTSTGITVSAGQHVVFSATGTWCLGGTTCGGPAGIRPRAADEPATLLLDSAQIGTLVGKAGEGPWFSVGTGGDITIPNAGLLVLQFNDLAGTYGDNSGAVTVDIATLPLPGAPVTATCPQTNDVVSFKPGDKVNGIAHFVTREQNLPGETDTMTVSEVDGAFAQTLAFTGIQDLTFSFTAQGTKLVACLAEGPVAGADEDDVVTIEATVTPLLRYVALGDSVPYGHGLANPTTAFRQANLVGGPTLPPNQGPSTQAYPSLLAQDLGLGTSFRVRPSGCNLAPDANGIPFDHLAASGAPSKLNSSVGADPLDCPADIRHKTVVGEDLTAAQLFQHPPSLVTIQVGANDIAFAECLGGLLRDHVKSNPVLRQQLVRDVVGPFLNSAGQGCTTKDQSGAIRITPAVQSRLNSLNGGLKAILQEIRRDAPNAKIIVLNYYQIMPAADAPVSGATLPCLALQARGTNPSRADLRSAANLIQTLLNKTIDGAIKASGVSVAKVDVSGLFAGHELCTKNSWLFNRGWNAGHPTAFGQCKIAAAIERQAGLVKPRSC